MTSSDRDRLATAKGMIAPSAVVWNLVVPALGVALLLGAAMLPAIALAAAASIALNAVLARDTRRGPRRGWISAHAASHRVARES